MIKLDRIIKIESYYYISGTISGDEVVKSIHDEFRIFHSKKEPKIFSLKCKSSLLSISTDIRKYHFNLNYTINLLWLIWWTKKVLNSIKNSRLSVFKKISDRVSISDNLETEGITENIEILNNPIAVVTHSMERLGAELVSLNIIKTLKDIGYSVITITLGSGELEAEFIENSDIFISNNTPISIITNTLVKNSCHNIICNSVQTGDISFYLGVQGFNIVSLVHELPNAISSLYAKDRLINHYRYSKKMIFPTEYVKSKILSAYKIADNKNIAIRHQGLYNIMVPIDIELAKSHVESIIGEKIDRPILLGIGNTTSRKGFDIFVETAELIDDAIFIWVGRKVDDFFNKTVKNKQPNNIFYVDSTSNLTPFYISSTALLITSREDPFPSVVLEAASLNRITIGFRDCGGFQEILENSLLAEKNDIKEFTKIIRYYISNSNEREHIANMLKLKIKKEFSFSKYVQYILNCF